MKMKDFVAHRLQFNLASWLLGKYTAPFVKDELVEEAIQKFLFPCEEELGSILPQLKEDSEKFKEQVFEYSCLFPDYCWEGMNTFINEKILIPAPPERKNDEAPKILVTISSDCVHCGKTWLMKELTRRLMRLGFTNINLVTDTSLQHFFDEMHNEEALAKHLADILESNPEFTIVEKLLNEPNQNSASIQISGAP